MRTHMLYTYGHTYSVKQIKKIHPFSERVVNIKDEYSDCAYTVTFDIKLAMELRMKGYGVLEWGCRYRGKSAFVFSKSRKTTLPF